MRGQVEVRGLARGAGRGGRRSAALGGRGAELGEHVRGRGAEHPGDRPGVGRWAVLKDRSREGAAAQLGEAGDGLAGAELEHGVGGGAVAAGVMQQLLGDRGAGEPAPLVPGDRAAHALGRAAGEEPQRGVVDPRVMHDQAQGLGAVDPSPRDEVEDDGREMRVRERGHHRGDRQIAGGAAGLVRERGPAPHPQLVEREPGLRARERGEAPGDHLAGGQRRAGREQPREPGPELGVVEACVLQHRR